MQQVAVFNETCYKRYTTEGHNETRLLNFLLSVVTLTCTIVITLYVVKRV